ncbi:ribonuclease H-like domain-containing protein [Methanobrevibacter woesei]|uniref:ribonuclease H-like domain-containing protein n=1 Tax=Methanobrevibacter woesei TaxID=190976 RepID=UPI002352C8AF|nr:ribonuclease H-like domain-containing protein [Methanobrevibacter woesei]
MSQREEHEKYLLKAILSHSLSSENPSDETKLRAYKNSPSFFKAYENELLDEYNGFNFNDFSDNKEISTSNGDTLEIVKKHKVNFKLKDNNFKNEIKSNLKLIPKIGIKIEEKLKKNGYCTWDDLKNHDSFCDNASKLSDSLEDMELKDILALLEDNRYSKECGLNSLKAASLVEPENFKFMDIETLGLSNVPIILIGVASIENNNVISKQYLLRDPIEEPALLEAYLDNLDDDSVHVTFNGKFFDVPFIKQRLNYYRMPTDKLNKPHFDLLHFARNLWKDQLPNCQLQTIEKEIFGIERENDVPGQFVPGFYDTYLKKSNVGPLVPIVEHNREDIVSLVSFLMKMYDEIN